MACIRERGRTQLHQHAMGRYEECAVPAAAGALSERLGNVALAHARWSDQKHVLVLVREQAGGCASSKGSATSWGWP